MYLSPSLVLLYLFVLEQCEVFLGFSKLLVRDRIHPINVKNSFSRELCLTLLMSYDLLLWS